MAKTPLFCSAVRRFLDLVQSTFKFQKSWSRRDDDAKKCECSEETEFFLLLRAHYTFLLNIQFILFISGAEHDQKKLWKLKQLKNDALGRFRCKNGSSLLFDSCGLSKFWMVALTKLWRTAIVQKNFIYKISFFSTLSTTKWCLVIAPVLKDL